MTFKQSAATWLVAQCEPLVPTLDRAVAERAFVAEVVKDPAWVTWWFTGVITDHMLTLPPADPWRHLSARVGPTLTRGTLPKPPPVTGATGVNGAFGTVADGHDIVHPSFSDAPTDVGLAAISGGLSAGGAALLAFACDGYRAAAQAAQLLHAEHLAREGDLQAAAGRFFGDAADALRWSVWRRRAYVGAMDDWTLATGFAWLWRAGELTANGRLPDGEWDEVHRAVEAERIDPDTYAQFAQNGS